MSDAKNVFGKSMQPCSTNPMTGFFRDGCEGCCRSGAGDIGLCTHKKKASRFLLCLGCLLVHMYSSFCAKGVCFADDVLFSHIVDVWKKSAIQSVVCEFELNQQSTRVERLALDPGPFGDGGNNDHNGNPGKSERFESVFFWSEKLGMRLKETNMLTGRVNDSSKLTNKSVGFVKDGEMLLGAIRPTEEDHLSGEAIVSYLLFWISPLATKDGTRIASLDEANLKEINHPKHGRCVELTIPGQREVQVQLAEAFFWRPINLRSFMMHNGIPSNLREVVFDYQQSPLGLPELVTMKFKLMNGGFFSEFMVDVRSVRFQCDKSDLEIQFPPSTVVKDSTGDKNPN